MTASDPLTDEQIRKRVVGVEDIDPKGFTKRHRVLSQTIFDMLFLRELISQSQHEAAHLFMDSLSKSGATVRSANLDIEVFTPHRDVGNVMGERRMAFSSAYREMVDRVGTEDANVSLRYFSDVYQYSDCYEDQAKVAEYIRPSLDALAIHYGTVSIHDSRELIRRLVGAGLKKNAGGGTR